MTRHEFVARWATYVGASERLQRKHAALMAMAERNLVTWEQFRRDGLEGTAG